VARPLPPKASEKHKNGCPANFRRKWMDLTASWKFVATILAFGFVAAVILGMI
jgi:hypothetical protein